jgi:hypothetical protein
MIYPIIIKINANTINMNNELKDWILIPLNCLLNAVAMFGKTIAESRKYTPRNNSKFPRIIG